MCFRILSLTLVLALPTAAFGVECSYFYSSLQHPRPITRVEKIRRSVLALPKKSYNLLFRNTVNDYRAAWSEGSVEGRPYRILKRIMLAPRVRVGELSAKEIDAFYRGTKGKDLSEIGKSARALGKEARQAEAEKKLQWLSVISEPAMDGVLEASSKLKQKFGSKLGMSNQPLKSNLSIPGGIAINAAMGFGTYAFLSDRIEQGRIKKLKEAAAQGAAAGIIGAPYLKEWADLGFLDPEQFRNLLDWNARRINEWGDQMNSMDPNRPLPPRFYQFHLEGLLKDQAEVSRFEEIALLALIEARKRKGNESENLKEILIAMLAADAVFSKKMEAERKILSLAFVPPVFIGENRDLSALESLMKGEIAGYLESLRDRSDIHWMMQLAKNPGLKPVRDLFPDADGNALPALFARLSASEDRSLLAEPWFPRNQFSSLKRADYFQTLYPASPFIDSGGKAVELVTEMDYLRNWQDHPFFYEEMKKWRESGRAFSARELNEMREKTNALQLVSELQKMARAEGRPESGRFAPDPNGAEACLLAEHDAFFKRYLGNLTSGTKSKNFCRYLLTLNFWRMSQLAQADRATREFGAEMIAGEMPKLEKKYLTLCEDPGYQEKFAKGAGISLQELEAKLGCQ